ncbi:hypothetical protein ABH944_008580 [Caballeronia udeis]|uniref:Uncharacterized protein n=1 Tax=Caballeronia udeis TaxID=1232866 RepID=A0ABW8MYY1_9BURK
MTLNQAVINAFTPTGKLRAAINLGNPILANRGPSTGLPESVQKLGSLAERANNAFCAATVSCGVR